jgi:ankyrin repeat protein
MPEIDQAIVEECVGESVLLAQGADVNQQSAAAAPIHGAVMGGSAEMLGWLLEHGADPALRDFQGRTARELALAMERPRLASLLSPPDGGKP